MGKTSKDKRDIYYRMAKEEGYRARSAFKLLELDETYNIFDSVQRVVDLCAAPGSWSQVVSKKIYVAADEKQRKDIHIVAVDMQDMSNLEGVTHVKGDITSESTAKEVIAKFGGKKAQLVLCDGAPDVTGAHAQDEANQSQLVNAAFNICTFLLEKNGTFVSKIFRAKNINWLYAQMNCFFKEVFCCKPRSSRMSSCEAFIVCRKYTPPDGYTPTLANPLQAPDYSEALEQLEGKNRILVPFMACGDLSGFDSDRTYPLNEKFKLLRQLTNRTDIFNAADGDDDQVNESCRLDYDSYDHRPIVQPPIAPSYETAKALKSAGLLANTGIGDHPADAAASLGDGQAALNILFDCALATLDDAD